MIDNLEGEIWKNIPNSAHYAISNKGRIKRSSHKRLHNINKTFFTTKDKLLTPNNSNTKKYWRIQVLYLDNSSIYESIHRLVAEAFIPNPLNLPQVNHKDGNKDNNNDWNLEWMTNQENMQHSFDIGLREEMLQKVSGENSYMNKYSEETIKKIPNLVKEGKTYAEISKELGIPLTLISEIKYKRAWKHLNLEIPTSKNYNNKK